MIDTHCHIGNDQFAADVDAVLARSAAAGVHSLVAPSTDAASARATLALAQGNSMIAPAVGIHPGSVPSRDWPEILDLARRPGVVAIGETGLDYYKHKSTATEQRASFLKHLQLAADLDLPVIVHNRDADDDILAALGDWHGVAILHCFTGTLAFAERALSLGHYVGIGGAITFKSNDALRATVSQLPLARLLLETDAPFMPPVPHRGERNEPAHTTLVAETLATIRGTTIEAIDEATTANAYAAFSRLPMLAAA